MGQQETDSNSPRAKSDLALGFSFSPQKAGDEMADGSGQGWERPAEGSLAKQRGLEKVLVGSSLINTESGVKRSPENSRPH